MSTELISKCDACGKEYSDKSEHLAECVRHVTLSFKGHPAVQFIPFDGDLCETCARELSKLITNFINEKSLIKVTKK